MDTSTPQYTQDMFKAISVLRFPLIIGIVFIHFNPSWTGFEIHGQSYGQNLPDYYHYFITYLSGVLSSICVPSFFFISGYLFFREKGLSFPIYKKKIKSRVWTLFVPFILWNIIAILKKSLCFLPQLSFLFPNSDLQFKFSLARLFNTFWGATLTSGMFVRKTVGVESLDVFPADAPLWYLRDLMVVTILAPVIYLFIKEKKVGVISLFFLWLSWLFVETLFYQGGGYLPRLITASLFFGWGGVFFC